MKQKQNNQNNLLLIKILSQEFWAIEPGKIEAMLRGMEAYSYYDSPRGAQVDVRDGTAIIGIEGVLMRGMGSWWGGISSIDDIEAAFKAALVDPDIDRIILNVDSPGGEVAGIKDLAHIIFNARETKEIITYTPWSMASAGYWLGAAAGAVYAAENSRVGSIGARYTHYDFSKMNENMGLKVTEIASGKWKTLGAEESPLDEESMAKLQEYVDDVALGFFEDIELFRGIPIDKIRSLEADVFSGKKSLEIGLIDGIKTISQIKKESTMDIKKIQAKFPGVNPITVSAIINMAKVQDPADEMIDEGKCKDLEKYWYDGKCNDEPKSPTAADPAEDMSDEAKCKDQGKYWYDDKCNDEPKSADATDPVAAIDPETKEDCEKKDGYEWADGKCQKKADDSGDSEASIALREVRAMKAAMNEMRQATARSIMDASISTATELTVQEKQAVRAKVCYKQFITASGVLDTDKYQAAIDVDIEAWRKNQRDKGMDGFGSSEPETKANAEEAGYWKDVKARAGK